MANREIYVSVDVESDGPIPGQNSMLSVGAVMIDIDKRVHGTFSRNLLTLEGAVQDPQTMEFWGRFPEAWEDATRDPVDPAVAMPELAAWLKDVSVNQGCRPIFVGFPGTFDFMWVHWYLMRFAGENPMGFAGMCLKSYAAGMRKIQFRNSVKSRFPKRWFDPLPHTHIALDDAIEQGAMAINLIRDNEGLDPVESLIWVNKES